MIIKSILVTFSVVCLALIISITLKGYLPNYFYKISYSIVSFGEIFWPSSSYIFTYLNYKFGNNQTTAVHFLFEIRTHFDHSLHSRLINNVFISGFKKEIHYGPTYREPPKFHKAPQNESVHFIQKGNLPKGMSESTLVRKLKII